MQMKTPTTREAVCLREARIDRAIHLAALAAAAAGCAVLVPVSALRLGLAGFLGVILYVIGLFAMLTCSALYNGCRTSPRRRILQRLDHAAIFLLIAGTYSAFFGGAIDDPRIALLLAAVWAIALVGLAGTLIVPKAMRRISIGLYLALGWSILAAIGPVWDRLSLLVLLLMIAGGILYSAGVIFHVLERVRYQNAIWHGFVVAAASCHFAAVVSNLPVA